MTQSQWRKSSIAKSKERGAAFKGPSTYRKKGGSGDSNQSRQPPCAICQVHKHNDGVKSLIIQARNAKKPASEIAQLKGQMRAVPHRKHRGQCTWSKRLKGQSPEGFQREQYMKVMTAINNVPPVIGGPGNVPTHKMTEYLPVHNNTGAEGYTGGAQARDNAIATVQNAGLISTSASIQASLEDQERWNTTKLATELRNELEKRLSDEPYLESLKKNCKAPIGIAVLADYINSQVATKRQKDKNMSSSPQFSVQYDSYRKYFAPGSIEFIFPCERRDRVPLPYYHAIEGFKYLYVDWTMSHPHIQLRCTESGCGGYLQRLRLEYQKNKTLVPIVTQDETTAYANVMKYFCKSCGVHIAGNEGALLASLPVEVRNAYPVLPRYASETGDRTFFHLSTVVSDDLEDNIVTYANGDKFSRKIWRRKVLGYNRRLLEYFSICRGKPHKPYLDIVEYCGDFQAPSGSQLYDTFKMAEKSPLTVSGISEFDRHRREIIGVKCEDNMAIDWTFEGLKNFTLKEQGAKAIFTMNNGDGEVAMAAIVPSTKVSDISHGVKQVSRRAYFNPKAIFTDTWPAKLEFWFSIFGRIVGVLGIFHFIKRIVDTLRPSHMSFHPALKDLQDCVYQYRQSCLEALISVLRRGTMSTGNPKPMTDEEIVAMRKTKAWRQRFARFLPKEILPPETIRIRLEEWYTKYKSDVDPISGHYLFAGTKDSVKNQKNHAEHIQWPDNVEMYTEIKPGPKSSHQLTSYRSKNPESQLESFHGQLANFGNGRMSDELADDIHLRGIADRNRKIRHQVAVRQGIYSVDKIKAHLSDLPLLGNHSFGKIINDLAHECGCSPPFPNVEVLPQDNGEQFLSQYFHAQQERNKTLSPPGKPPQDLCRCPECNGVAELPTAVQQSPPTQLKVPPPTSQQPSRYLAILPAPPPVDNPAPCCSIFGEYQRKGQGGCLPPGRPPHDNFCPVKLRQQQSRSSWSVPGLDEMPSI